MTVYVIIHTTVDDTETHHREIVPKIMRAVERHGGKRIARGHGEQLRVHLGEPPNANRLVFHEFPSLEAVEAWVEDVKANREPLHTLGDLTSSACRRSDQSGAREDFAPDTWTTRTRLNALDPGTPLRP
jgi:uncharacterized protein (DUF1330 family)